MPEGLLVIGGKAFEGCFSLQHIEIPSTISHIHGEAFNNSGIKEVTVPKHCVSLNDLASGVTFVEKDREEGYTL